MPTWTSPAGVGMRLPRVPVPRGRAEVAVFPAEGRLRAVTGDREIPWGMAPALEAADVA
jgi:hypothetical protein